MSRYCKYCKQIISGRTDKKFCDINCRTAFHNSRLNEKESVIQKVNKILRKNRSVLKFLSPQGKTTVRKSLLLNQGFNFHYYTHHYTTKNDNTYTFCYDYGYLELEDQKVLVISKPLKIT